METIKKLKVMSKVEEIKRKLANLEKLEEKQDEDDIPCWSLTALLNILPSPHLSNDKLGGGKTGWMVSVYPDNCRHDSCWYDNPVDACVGMIIKFKELNLL